MSVEKESFLKNHADTIAIIGVNLAVAAILLTICLSNISSIACTNARMDTMYARMDTMYVMFYDLLREGKK